MAKIGHITSETQAPITIDRAIDDRIADIRTAIPAKVTKFDKDKNTVNVKILVKEWVGDKAEEIDELKELPILMFGNKKIMITIPIKEGDEGLVIFNDRSIDEHEEGFEEIRDNRSHNVSDGVFIPLQLRYKDDLIKKYNTNDMEFRAKCVDDLRLQIDPEKKQIRAGFKKEKDQLKMKLDEVEIMTNDEKTKIKITKEKIEIDINDKNKLKIENDLITFDEKVEFKKEVKFLQKATFETRLEAKGDIKMNGNIDLNGAVKINGITQTGN